MLKLYNGKEINVKNVLELLQEQEESGGHMTDYEVDVIKKVAAQNYDNCDEDLEYLVEKLIQDEKIGANWQTVYDILSKGEWYYQIGWEPNLEE